MEEIRSWTFDFMKYGPEPCAEVWTVTEWQTDVWTVTEWQTDVNLPE